MASCRALLTTALMLGLARCRLRTLSALVALVSLASAQDLDSLERQLGSDDDRVRRKAVQELASLDTLEGWELVLRALRDPAPQVADEAQLALRGVDTEDELALLLGKEGVRSRVELVQLRALEALGFVELDVEASVVERALKSKSQATVRAALHSAERLAGAGFLSGDTDRITKACERLSQKGKNEELMAAALACLGALQEDGGLELGQANLGRMSGAVRVAALGLVCARDPRQQQETVRRMAGSADARVRREAVRQALRSNTRFGVETLIMRLDVEQEQRLAWTIVAHLRSLSGRKGGRDPRAWKEWLETLPEQWEPGHDLTSGRAEDADAPRSASFVGLPILSDRVVFLVDFSGSLWAEREGGKTRKDVVDVELRRALEHLPEEARFNLIPYANDPKPWEDELVSASDRRIQKALEWFERSRLRGQGNFWDALMLALEDPEVDSVMVLTDGAPTGGTRWNLGLMRDLLRERNRFRHIVLDAVLVDAKSGLESRWRAMCADTGGRVLSVQL